MRSDKRGQDPVAMQGGRFVDRQVSLGLYSQISWNFVLRVDAQLRPSKVHGRDRTLILSLNRPALKHRSFHFAKTDRVHPEFMPDTTFCKAGASLSLTLARTSLPDNGVSRRRRQLGRLF